MSIFADFALLAAIPSYGGAEILRAQRILPSGAGPRVHIALLGKNSDAAARAVSVAEAARRCRHGAVPRVLEVGRFEGVFFAVGEPAEGVSLPAIVASERGRGLPGPLAVAVAVALATLADELAGAGTPLSLLSPFGLSPDALLLCPDGRLRLRTLAAIASDPLVSAAFVAPELSWSTPSSASEVWTIAAHLRALLVQGALPEDLDQAVRATLRSTLSPVPERRPDFADFERKLMPALGGRSPRQVVAEALAAKHRRLIVAEISSFIPALHIVESVRHALARIYAQVEWLYPLPGGGGDDVDADDDDVFASARTAGPSQSRAGIAPTVLIDDIPAIGRTKLPSTVVTTIEPLLGEELTGLATKDVGSGSSDLGFAAASPASGHSTTATAVFLETDNLSLLSEQDYSLLDEPADDDEEATAGLVVEAPAGAAVRVDGRMIGAGRVEVRGLRPGTATVEVAHPAHRVWAGHAELRANEVSMCRPSLLPK